MAATALLTLAVHICVVSPNCARAGDTIRSTGDILQLALPSAAAGIALGKDGKSGVLEFGRATAFAMGTTYVLKLAVDERRPNGGNFSFPSGHTSISFCSAEFLRARYGRGWGAPAYVLASFVGYSRIEAREHYAHDVVAGALIGILSDHLPRWGRRRPRMLYGRTPAGWTVAVVQIW